jgi:hypothetical protein
MPGGADARQRDLRRASVRVRLHVRERLSQVQQRVRGQYDDSDVRKPLHALSDGSERQRGMRRQQLQPRLQNGLCALREQLRSMRRQWPTLLLGHDLQ